MYMRQREGMQQPKVEVQSYQGRHASYHLRPVSVSVSDDNMYMWNGNKELCLMWSVEIY